MDNWCFGVNEALQMRKEYEGCVVNLGNDVYFWTNATELAVDLVLPLCVNRKQVTSVSAAPVATQTRPRHR